MNNSHLLQEATQFITQCYTELNKTYEIEDRLSQIKKEIGEQNHYNHTYEELEHGAKMAWRNSNRCIGRLFWNSLHVVDERNLTTEEQMFQSLLHHIENATNGGKIRPMITIFKPRYEDQEVRIWNHQLIRYAGYQTEYGFVGDPASLPFTKLCQKLGWQGDGTHFDVLPIVIQVNHQEPKWFEIPKELILEVELHHPEFKWFKDFQLKWYAVPMVSDMKLEIGGIEYTAAPFNGWYMGTEIGARNLADPDRYHMLPKIASSMGLDITKNSSLWKDKALVELNIAVIDSYKKVGVSIVDHHTAAEQFKLFEEIERKNERPITGNWTWLIPPLSPATTHIFHQPYSNTINKPNYFYQKPLYNKE